MVDHPHRVIIRTGKILRAYSIPPTTARNMIDALERTGDRYYPTPSQPAPPQVSTLPK